MIAGGSRWSLCLVCALVLLLGIRLHGVIGAECLKLEEFVEPRFSAARNIVAFFENSWTAYFRSHLADDLPRNLDVQEAVKRIYESREFQLFFVDGNFSVKPFARIIIDVVSRMQNLEGKVFPGLDQVKRGIVGLKRLKQNFTYSPPPVFAQNVHFCFSGNKAERVQIVSLLEEDGDFERTLVVWAQKRIDLYRHLIDIATSLDIRLSGLLVQYIKYVNPFELTKADYIDRFGHWDSLENYMLSLEPTDPHFISLKKILPFYCKLKDVGQIFLSDGPSLKEGMSGEGVLNLQRRLIQEGWLAKEKATGFFDSDTKKAVKRFQSAHFLESDGIVGPKTRRCLNISFATKYRWIVASMDFFRTCPCRNFPLYVWINIPTFSLEFRKGGKTVSVHKVVVGKPTGRPIRVKGKNIHWNNTLPLISEIKTIVFKPRWYVPERIRKEMERDLQKNPHYFEEEGFRFMNSFYSWGEPRVYQLPGETNPMGRVKFLFDNPFGIFLHDTSQPHLFKKPFRAFSHGCVRVENALKLAKLVLKEGNPKALSRMQKYLTKRDQSYVPLKKKIPIVISYVPVLSDMSNGSPIFGGDPYGWLEGSGMPMFFFCNRRLSGF